MPNVYHYLEGPYAVSQRRYDSLIGGGRPGWYTTPTARIPDGTIQVGGIPATDVRAAQKFPYPRPKVLQNITSMQSGHGWTASNALANAMNDNTAFVIGAQSAYITSKTDTTAATITSGTLALDMSATKTIRLLVMVTGGDNIQGMSLYATSDNFAANYSFSNIQNVVADPSVRWLKDGEWKWVTVNMASSASATGGVTGKPNYAAIDHLRIRLTTTTGTSATVHLQAVQVVERRSFASGGIVCF